MSDKDDLSGRQIGEFVLGERIGEGGFGAVYRCEQPTLEREAVIKVLHGQLRRSDVIVQRFMREALLASRLDHPYAAHVYAYGMVESDALLWIAMERVHGVTLAQWLSTHGPMPLPQFVAFFERIAEVVQTAHDRGIVHRDLKPSNVMVIERAGKLLPKLLDFGVAMMLDTAALPEGTPDLRYDDAPPPAADELSGKSPVVVVRSLDMSTVTDVPPRGEGRLTLNNQTVGSPPYMSPELWNNPGTVGPASDLYALGVLAFEALTGRRPFEGATLTDYIELHCRGKVPALGSSFPPALDRMLQRAMAKRPEDRWGTALDLASALRAASGVGAIDADLPRIDESVRDAWLGEAPQPLAESVAAIDGAGNIDRVRDMAQELVRTLLRYLLVLALATRPRAGEDAPSLLELVRALSKRDLLAKERLQLLRLLVPRGDHPVPELVDLVTPGPDGTDPLKPILDLYSIKDHSGSEESRRMRMRQQLAVLSRLLHKMRFLLAYVLVVPRGGAAERWTGRRQKHREPAAVLDGELIEGHPMLLDRNGRICADLWPLMQAVAPTDGADPELFVFDGRGPHGAQLIAARRGAVHDDSRAWEWVEQHLIAEVETKARMRHQIQTAAQQWEDRGRSNALLWRGDVLADYEHWTRHTAAPPLPDREAAFIAASRRGARRRRWGWGGLVAVGIATALVGVVYRAHMQSEVAEEHAALAKQQAQTAQQIADASVTTSHVEQGRAALLHNEFAEAQNRLREAYQRGDHSPALEFMLARALQPRMAELARFPAVKGRVWSASFSPDDTRIVTADDKAAQVWDSRTSRLLFTLPHSDTVYDARYTADGSRIVTAGGDDLVRIWDAATGMLVRELRHDGKPSRYIAEALSPGSNFVAAIDTSGDVARVWYATTGAVLAELSNDASGFPSIAFSADGHWLATSGGNDVRVFDTRTWTRTLTIAGPRIRALSFDPTGPRLATGSATGDATIWEVPSGARTRRLRERGESVDAIAFSPDGQHVATGSADGAEQVWDAASGALQSQLNALQSKIITLEWDPASKLVVAAGDSGSVVVADIATAMPVTRLEGPRNLVWAVHFDHTSRRVAGASWDGTARIWDATPPYRRWSSPPIADDCGLVASLEPDRRFVAIGCRNHATRVLDTARDQLLAELPSVTPVAGDFASAFPAVDADGDRAAIARGNTVEIYEVPSTRLLRVIRHGAAVNAVAFGPSGHDLVSGAIDGSLLVTRDGQEPIALPACSGGVDAASLLPDGRVVVADVQRRLRVYAPELDRVLADLELPTRVRMLRSSPDGLRLITIPSYTGTAAPPVLLDLGRYRLVVQLEGHVGRVYSARFVDGAIVTAGGDGAVRLWDGKTGGLRQTYLGSTGFLVDATVTPDGSMVVAGGGDGVVRFWDVPSGRLLWTLPAHKSIVVGIRIAGDDIVTRGFAGDISRWTLPSPGQVIEATSTK